MRRDCIDGPRRASAAELRSQADCSGPQMRESPLHARMGITGEPLPAMWHAVPQPPVVEFILYWCRMCSSRLQNVLPDWGCAMLCRRPLYAAVQGRQPAGQGCELYSPLQAPRLHDRHHPGTKSPKILCIVTLYSMLGH